MKRVMSNSVMQQSSAKQDFLPLLSTESFSLVSVQSDSSIELLLPHEFSLAVVYLFIPHKWQEDSWTGHSV